MSVTPLPLQRRDPPAANESLAEATRRLHDESLAKAQDHSRAMELAVSELEAVADQIANGGDAYLPGVREVARRLALELGHARTSLTAILCRNGV
ncbi:MAG TPA: hypothetical protein VKT30_16930 [Caulobacteraceae bacterium]|nr:hypothetical protein [Caulobacteraceae bacterium]